VRNPFVRPVPPPRRFSAPSLPVWDAASWPNARRRLEVTLCLSHGCALECAYCYRQHKAGKPAPVMPVEVARRAVDYFLEEYPGGAHGRRNGSTQRCSPTPDAHPFQAQTYSLACDNPDDPHLDRTPVHEVMDYAL